MAASLLKKAFISTPIFYPNARPHIGHLFTAIIADYLKRVNQLRGLEVFLSTGTDEHGSKMMRTAEKLGIGNVRTLCDANSALFQDMAVHASISYDTFVRTTEGPSHVSLSPPHQGCDRLLGETGCWQLRVQGNALRLLPQQ